MDVYDHQSEDEENMSRMEIDGTYEYEMPKNFKDEEVDEDEAFNSEDEEEFGMFFSKNSQETDNESEDGEGDLLSDMLCASSTSKLPVSEDDRNSNLAALVDQLNPSKSETEHEGKVLETTERGLESEYSSIIRDNGSLNASGKVTLSALLGGDDLSTDASTARVKKQLAGVEHSSLSSGLLSAPLAPVHSARVNRKVVYSKKSEDVSEYQGVVKENREKDCLDFRSQLPPRQNISNAALSSKFEASNPLEKSVQNLLNVSGLSQSKIAANEEEELGHRLASTEEVENRKNELSKMRALMFYEEQKAKRVKKIKSKLFHKIRNKKKRVDEEKERDRLRELDPDMARQLDLEDAEKRAEERMTLKHSNSSKWVKHKLKLGINADNTSRKAIAQQLELGQRLRKKMQTTNEESETSDEDVSDEGDHSIDETTRLHKKLSRKADALLVDIENDETAIQKAKGLHGMKFMQRAVEKQRLQAKEKAEELLLELKAANDGETHVQSNDEAASTGNNSALAKKKVAKKEDVSLIQRELLPGAIQMRSLAVNNGHTTTTSQKRALEDSNSSTNEGANPWLESSKSSKSRSRKRKKRSSKGKGEECDVLNVQDVMNFDGDSTKVEGKKKVALKSGAEKLSEQESLVHQAFSFVGGEDNTLEQEKEQLASQDTDVKHGAEIARMMGVSGWGSWAGEGVQMSKRQKARHEEAKVTASALKASTLQSRKDFGMGHVLINERKDKKAAKFMCKDVPYPFTTREQYELAMRNPLGSDWNTTQSTTELNVPKVITRAGISIAPLKLNKEQKRKAKQLSTGRKAKF